MDELLAKGPRSSPKKPLHCCHGGGREGLCGIYLSKLYENRGSIDTADLKISIDTGSDLNLALS